MSRLLVSNAADGFCWRLIANDGTEFARSNRPFASQEAAVHSAYHFRQLVATSPVVDESGAVLDAPLVFNLDGVHPAPV